MKPPPYSSTKAIILKAALAFLAYLGVLFWIERIPVAKPVVMGAFVIPDPFPGVPTITKSEQFIRDKAIYRVTPVAHADGSNPINGDAIVKIIISPSGAVEMATLIKGPESIKGIAEEAARRWEFEPMNDGGKPVRIESTLTFHFGRLRPEGVNRRPVEEKKACDECL